MTTPNTWELNISSVTRLVLTIVYSLKVKLFNLSSRSIKNIEDGEKNRKEKKKKKKEEIRGTLFMFLGSYIFKGVCRGAPPKEFEIKIHQKLSRPLLCLRKAKLSALIISA